MKNTPIFLFLLLFVALSLRVAGIFVTNTFGVNPFDGGQAVAHAARASEIAEMYSTGSLDISFSNTFDRWGLLLSPFWLLPGPSGLYAQLGMATLGTASVFNVYLIASHFHSRLAGFFAAIPIAVFPTYVFMHSVVQREALILFGLTSAFILVFLPPRYLRKSVRYPLAIGGLLVAGYLRLTTLPVLLAIAMFVLFIAFLTSDRVSKSLKASVGSAIGVLGVGIVYIAITRFVAELDEVIAYLADVRARRVRGRATYLPDAIPSSLLELIAFSWIGAIYFLFTPFPWHLESVLDIGGLAESIIGITYALFAVLGALVLKERTLLGTLALVSLIILFSVLFGFGTANYGTAVRHRQTVFWAIFILGAIGISSKVQFKT